MKLQNGQKRKMGLLTLDFKRIGSRIDEGSITRRKADSWQHNETAVMLGIEKSLDFIKKKCCRAMHVASLRGAAPRG